MTNKTFQMLLEFTTSFKMHLDKLLNKKVDKEEGKGLSSNDYTTEEKEKLASIKPISFTTITTVSNTVSENGVLPDNINYDDLFSKYNIFIIKSNTLNLSSIISFIIKDENTSNEFQLKMYGILEGNYVEYIYTFNKDTNTSNLSFLSGKKITYKKALLLADQISIKDLDSIENVTILAAKI